MHISSKTRYATRALLELALNEGQGAMTLQEVAARQGPLVNRVERGLVFVGVAFGAGSVALQHILAAALSRHRRMGHLGVAGMAVEAHQAFSPMDRLVEGTGVDGDGEQLAGGECDGLAGGGMTGEAGLILCAARRLGR